MTRIEKWKKLAPEAKINGISEWKSIEQVKASNLNWSTNGNQRLGKFFGLKEFLCVTRRNGNTIPALRTTGFDTDEINAKHLAERPLSKRNRKHIELSHKHITEPTRPS